MMHSQRALTIEDICNKLRPVLGKKIDSVYLKYTMANSREEKEEIAQILHALYSKNLSKLLSQNVLLEPPKDLDGEYKLANISYANKNVGEFRLREQDWVRHVCITGMSGSGKTTMAFHLLDNFLEKKKKFLIFDWKKSFRPLLTKDSEILHFTIGNNKVSNLFKTNINQPPKGVAPKEWINVLCDLLTEAFSVSFGVHKVLLETLDEAFKEWGIYAGSSNYPTWYHIKWRLDQKLEKANGRESTWLESAARIASVLTFGSFADVVNYKGKNSMNIEDLLDKKIILELNSLGSVEKKFFCDFVLTYIFKLKKARQNNVNGKFDHAIVVDEAHNIFLKKDTNFTNESVTDMIYREMREYGTSLICLDQHISKLSDAVKGNSACHIAFQQQLPQDIREISGIMQLQDKPDYFTKLAVGSAIVKLSERHTMPFLINVDEVDLRKDEVSDSYINNRMKAMFASKEVEDGKDKKFEEKLKNENSNVENNIEKNIAKAKKEEKEEKDNKVRIPKHANYDGELEKVEKYKLEIQKNLKKPLDVLKKEKLYNSGIKYKPIEKAREKVIKTNEIPEIPKMPKISQKIVKEKTETLLKNDDPVEKLKEKVKNEFLTNSQKELYNYVEKRINKAITLMEIERVMEDHIDYSLYNLTDIAIVINHAINKRTSILRGEVEKNELKISEKKLPDLDNVVTIKEEQNKKIYKAKLPSFPTQVVVKNTHLNSDLNEEQKMFLSFLQKNPDHNLSSVEFYKMVGLSARKGTVTKKELIELGLIQIEEVKYDKGWKKIIRLN
jgi:hypothetical protein